MISWSDGGVSVGDEGSGMGSGSSLAGFLLELKKDQDMMKSQIEEDVSF
jgi:hypothetical protein